jgi:alpha-mannosidase
VHELGENVAQGALASIAAWLGGDLLLVNPTSFPRRDLALWPGVEGGDQRLYTVEDVPVLTQSVDRGLLLDAGDLPPHSVTALNSLASQPSRRETPSALTVTPNLLENDLIRVELDDAGDIVRIYDKACRREVLPPGAIANQFQAFEDRPKTPDAWEIEIYYDDVQWLAEPASLVAVVEQGPLRAALEIRRRISGSDICQRIMLAHNSARLDFETTVQWRERHVMLKVAFPVEVLSPVATYEIQWGSVERPTHRNTSWDWARFEVAAQKWVDLSEGGFGVSLLNDCKYGHDIRDNVMRLTLLRSPTDPDPTADLGEHTFTYSLLPHGGGWRETTAAQAYALNDPLRVWSQEGDVTGSGSKRLPSFIRSSAGHVIVETIKRAQDGQGFIVRLYESQRQRGEFDLLTGFPLAAAWRTNLLEENQEPLEVDGHRLRCPIKPFQIVTLRLLPERTAGGQGRG